MAGMVGCMHELPSFVLGSSACLAGMALHAALHCTRRVVSCGGKIIVRGPQGVSWGWGGGVGGRRVGEAFVRGPLYLGSQALNLLFVYQDNILLLVG